MDAKDLETELKVALTRSGYTLTALVQELNKKGKSTTIQNVSNKIKRGSLNYLEVEEILNAVGYKIEWVKK